MGPRSLARRSRDRLVLAAVGGAAFAASLYLLGPGWMTIDSGAHFAQARSLELADDHPPLMALIWHVTDRVVPGPLGMLALMAALYWSGLTALFTALPGPLAARCVALVAVGAYPPAAANLPTICKDNMMQGALLVGAACLAIASARRGWRRGALWAAAAIAILIAVGVRHNGAAAAWPLLMIPLLELPLLERAAPPLRWLAAASASLVATLLLTLALGKAIAPLAKKTEFWQIVPVFDLAGMSLATGQVLVEPQTGVLTRGMGLGEIGAKYSPRYVNSLYYCLPFQGKRCVPVFRRTLDPERLQRLRKNWLSAILRHPRAYLEHRYRVADRLLGDGAPALYFVERAPHTPAALDYPPPERTLRLLRWVDAQFGSGWFLPAVYVSLSVLLLPIAVVLRRRGAPALPIFLLLSGLSYIASCVLTTGASDFRYTVYTNMCCVLALAAVVVSLERAALAGAWASIARRLGQRQGASRGELEPPLAP